MNTEVRQVVLQGLEQQLRPLQEAQLAAVRPARGWLRAVREAIGVRQGNVARRLGVKRQSYAQFETAEERGSISLASLQRAAGAMECELIYFIVPRKTVARTYTELARIHDPAFKHLVATEHSMVLEDQAVGDLKPRPSPEASS